MADVDAVLTAFGKISSLTGLSYWSVTDQRWEALITAATALDPTSRRPRVDFTPSEFREGHDLIFAQRENRLAADIVYRLRPVEVTPRRVVIQAENVTGAQRFLMTAIAPGDLQLVYFFDAAPEPGRWKVYILTRVGTGGSILSALISESSYINRAVAFYRHVAAIPSDMDPPAAAR